MDKRLISKKLGEVYMLLHMDCCLKCKVCPYWGITGACKNKEFLRRYSKKLQYERIKSFVDEISKYNPSTINLSGGEPLLNNQWIKVAKYLKKRGLKVTLSTNGIYISKYFEEIINYVDSIIISFKGTKDILKDVCSLDYKFDEVLYNIKKISDFKRDANTKRPRIKIIYIISDLSYHKIREFYEYFMKKNITIDTFYFQHAMFIDKNNLNAQKRILRFNNFTPMIWDGFLYKFGTINFQNLFEQIDYLKKFDNVTFSPDMDKEEIKKYYSPQKKDSIKKGFICSAPWDQADVYPNGDIMVCPDYVIGNIYEKSFDEIWNGKKVVNLRKFVLENKKFPGCKSCFYYYVSNERCAKKC